MRIREEIRKHLKTIGNGNTPFQNLWVVVKVVLTGKFTAVQAYVKKQENCQINLACRLKEVEKKSRKAKVNLPRQKLDP